MSLTDNKIEELLEPILNVVGTSVFTYKSYYIREALRQAMRAALKFQSNMEKENNPMPNIGDLRVEILSKSMTDGINRLVAEFSVSEDCAKEIGRAHV